MPKTTFTVDLEYSESFRLAEIAAEYCGYVDQHPEPSEAMLKWRERFTEQLKRITDSGLKAD